MKYGTHYVSVLAGLFLALTPAMVTAQVTGSPARGESVTVALVDPSLRSPLAAPTVQLAAEVGDDTKYATGKVGFALTPRWSSEVGFTAAFDQDGTAEQPSSLRRLTDGSSLWAATTWTASHANRWATPLLSARFEASQSEFDFYDTALSRHSETHTTYAVTATAGLLLPKDGLVAASYRWSDAWRVGDDPESCHFVAERGDVMCPADRLFRAPTPYQRHQFEAQVQTRLGDKVGVELFLTRDFRDDAWGIDVPVYFIARPTGGFTGGMVFTYNGARDRYDVAVFVGQVFRLFK